MDLIELTQMQAAVVTLVVLGVMFVLFLREVFPTEVVALLGVSVLLLTGALAYDDAVAVLSRVACSSSHRSP